MVDELYLLASHLDTVTLTVGQTDTITWRFNSKEEYTASSAYRLQFAGSMAMEGYKLIWSGWAPGKCRFFPLDGCLGKDLNGGGVTAPRLGEQLFLPPL